MLTRKEKLLKEIKGIVIIVAVVFSFRTVAFDHYRVPTGSMIPTLNIGDQIVVNKMAYDLKLPFSEYFKNPISLLRRRTPKKGEVIVFKDPKLSGKTLVKRVIGVPGDTLEVKNKIVYINGKPLMMYAVNGSVYQKEMIRKYQEIPFRFYKTQSGAANHVIQLTEFPSPLDDFKPVKIPPGNFFVMGDNRDFSSDSRSWGLVPREKILGKAQRVWMSMSLPMSGGEFKFRPSRTWVKI
jgi:signal peptidase I